MIYRTTLEVAAVGGAHHDRRGEVAVGAPAEDGQLVANLHVGGPDVVEELNFHDRLEPSGGESDGPAHDIGFGQWRIVDPPSAELFLQAPGHLEDPTLALEVIEMLLAADVGYILAENQDAGVAPHFFLEADVDQVNHRCRFAAVLRVLFRVELLGRGIHVRRVDVVVHRVAGRLR